MVKHKNKSHKKFLYSTTFLAALVVLVVILEATNTTHFFHKSATVVNLPKPITSLPDKSSATSKTSTIGNNISPGSANDENGKAVSGVPNNPSDWTTSSSGVIVLKLPGNNTTFQSGDTITGTSSVNPVDYRLIDNQVGVIAQGQLDVVNGTFTAAVSFTPYATGGQLDIYSTDSTGKELNEIQIAVNF